MNQQTIADDGLKQKQQYCEGCRNDFYNHRTDFDGATHCWSLDDAQIVKRFRIHWWTTPTTPGAFTEVRTLSCHHAPGKYAHYEKLPDFAVNPHRIERHDAANSTHGGEL